MRAGHAVVCSALLLLTLTPFGTAQAHAAPTLTLDDLFASPSLFGTQPSAPEWSPDSRYFAFGWNDAGYPQRGLWLATADGRTVRNLKAATDDVSSVRELAWLPDSSAILTLRGVELWQTAIDTGDTLLLGTVGPGASTLSIAPNGQLAAFLKDGDLWVLDLATRKQRALTRVGISGLSSLSVGRYNRAEREIGPGIWGGPSYAWSPDSETIAVHQVDRRGMRKVPFPDYLAKETSPNEVRRGYPGDSNESRSVGLLEVTSGRLQTLALEQPSATQIVGLSWSSKGQLLVDTATDTAVDRRLFTVENTDDPALREVWHSHRDTRIYTSFAASWHADGERIVFLDDLEDRYGLYSIDAFADDRQPTRLSDPAFDVLAGPKITPSGAVFYTANNPSARESQVYRIGEDGQVTRVSGLPGQNNPYPSPDGRHAAFIHNSDSTPPDIYVAAAEGEPARRVTTSPLPVFAAYSWARSRYVSFPSAIDDYMLRARILEPPSLEPGRRYPVLFGPMYSNTVRNRWAGVYSRIQQLLVQKGYIVVQVDMRGSTGYGRDFREEFLVDFAGDDLEDIASAVRYMQTLPYTDANRFGIWGSSYGGTLSVYSLLKKPGLFRAGVAAAAAVNPHFFGTDDVAIVRRPDTHPEIFLNTAARFAANLEDHLLIIHGMQDQVVPFKTTAALADILIKNGKDFDFVFAPGATHAWSREEHYSRYLFGKMLAHFDRYLMTERDQP